MADELAEARAEIAELRSRLLEAEQELGGLTELQQRSAELDRVKSSPSWRIAEVLAAPWRPFRRRLTVLRGTAVGRAIAGVSRGLRS
jgi:hypothetical protein